MEMMECLHRQQLQLLLLWPQLLRRLRRMCCRTGIPIRMDYAYYTFEMLIVSLKAIYGTRYFQAIALGIP